jgi:transmembrane sensor
LSEPVKPLSLSATEIDARAASWLIRHREHENWSEADQAALDAWLAESWAHSAAYWRVKAAWSYADRLSMVPRPLQGSRLVEAARHIFPGVLRIAASIAVVAALGAGILFLQKPKPQERTYATLLGGRETLAFADGTKVELNTDTVIRASMTTAERIVWLDRGEAYFAVKHDSAHPFVVIAGGRRITDLGTKFIVRNDTGRTEVAVTQGRVRFEAPGDGRRSRVAMLIPGDVATASGSAMSLTRKTSDELANQLSWMHGLLIFKHTALGDAVSEFNRYNQTKLVIADPVVAALEIRGTFQTKDAALFARVVRAALKLHVENDGTEIVISR